MVLDATALIHGAVLQPQSRARGQPEKPQRRSPLRHEISPNNGGSSSARRPSTPDIVFVNDADEQPHRLHICRDGQRPTPAKAGAVLGVPDGDKYLLIFKRHLARAAGSLPLLHDLQEACDERSAQQGAPRSGSTRNGPPGPGPSGTQADLSGRGQSHPTRRHERVTRIGRLVKLMAVGPQMENDCGLVELHGHTGGISPLTPDEDRTTWQVGDLADNGDHPVRVLVLTPAGAVEADLCPAKMRYWSYGQQKFLAASMVYLDRDLRDDDCGSSIVDPHHRRVYGFIVAGHGRVAHVLSAETILSRVRAELEQEVVIRSLSFAAHLPKGARHGIDRDEDLESSRAVAPSHSGTTLARGVATMPSSMDVTAANPLHVSTNAVPNDTNGRGVFHRDSESESLQGHDIDAMEVRAARKVEKLQSNAADSGELARKSAWYHKCKAKCKALLRMGRKKGDEWKLGRRSRSQVK